MTSSDAETDSKPIIIIFGLGFGFNLIVRQVSPDCSISRFNLKGKNAGKAEVFAENLPCLPDNIGSSSKGGYWIGSFLSRHKDKKFNFLDFLGPRAWLRRILAQVRLMALATAMSIYL